jgi:hypothetical protein
MAYTTINKSSDYFNTVLWTTDGTGNKALTTGHSTDMVWIKFRDYAYDHRIYDDVRGVTKKIIPNKTDAESTTTDLASFDTNGFTVGSNLNSSGEGGLVGWSWKANGQGSSNTDGTINTTYTSANTTSGFSISQYTGTGSAATIGHGLGVTPKMIIVKRTNTTGGWTIYHSSVGNTKYLYLNTTDAEATASSIWNNTSPTSSLFTVGTDGEVNGSGSTYVAYCFAEKQGYSKFGTYTGNGNADGSFIYTGFKPAWIMLKDTNSGSAGWMMFDNKRLGYNVDNNALYPNANSAEGTGDDVDLLSNGFKARSTDAGINTSGNSYIYMAFGQSLVGSNNIPCTSR